VPEDERVVLVFGGSLGARTINEAAVEAFAGANPGYRVLHCAGERDLPGLRGRVSAAHYDLRGFVDDFAQALAAADLVVARAGGSVFEIAAAGRPAILVPYPHAAGDHQAGNAAWMERAGAAIAIRDEDLTAARLRSEVDTLMADAERLAAMGRASAALARPDAAQAIARELMAAGQAGAR
jgi:UDP-N-acetylglucosamine--N-acetylmuramyl-(pentapeptide) pyrophosphoryl-undecaprenol N-acetylglucosamine transferase